MIGKDHHGLKSLRERYIYIHTHNHLTSSGGERTCSAHSWLPTIPYPPLHNGGEVNDSLRHREHGGYLPCLQL